MLCFDWLKEIRLNFIIITVYEYVSYRILHCGIWPSISRFVKVWLGLMWSYLWRGGYNITCHFLGLCTWEGVRIGGRVLQIQIIRALIFWVKNFWAHSIYCFMLLVQGVRLDWLVFHMINFLLMHILQGCIWTFDERHRLNR